MGASVVVVGSANLDIVVPVERHPASGETILGGTLARHPGGKGANQAVGCAVAGGVATVLVACLGDDDGSELLRHSLVANGVDVSLLQQDHTTGTALIWVTPAGDNTIIVAPGANSRVVLTEDAHRAIDKADVVLSQLEIPLDVVIETARACSESTPFVLNAAPSRPLPPELLAEVDVLVVNEHEAADVAGSGAAPTDLMDVLLGMVPAVVITLGADGALVGTRRDGCRHLRAHVVEPVDTTGAGDVFCGVLCASLARGLDLVESASHASIAAALATQGHGAQSYVPSADLVRRVSASADLIGPVVAAD